MQRKRIYFWASIALAVIAYIYAPVNAVGRDLRLHYEQFMDLYNVYCPHKSLPNKIIVKYRRLPDGIIGLCSSNRVSATVSIDPDYWKSAEYSLRKQLMFHELTHCFLDLDHDESDKHYMNSYVTEISNQDLINQTIENMKLVCGD